MSSNSQTSSTGKKRIQSLEVKLYWNENTNRQSKSLTQINDDYRLLNMGLLSKTITEVTTHIALCQNAQDLVRNGAEPLSSFNEMKQHGFASVFSLSCKGCNKTFDLQSSNTLPGNSNIYDINLRSVWGTMVTGGGLSSLNELFATMNVAGMRQNDFSSLEQVIGYHWNEMLKKDMMQAGAEERRLAIERKDFHEGVPAISVVCDGGWSKRSHRHTYNALGGVAVIFGAVTGKLLHIGVRNKHCYICSSAESRHCQPRQHQCFRNWDESSQAMEADVIVEGFKEAERLHGLRYMRVIADGDSSVYARIQQEVPVWGSSVSKMECANHACKCLRSNLEKLVENKPHYKGAGKLTKQVRQRLVKGVRCAIKIRSAEKNKNQALKQLEHDIRNSVHHVFGHHENCSNFCKGRPRPTVKDQSCSQEDVSAAADSSDTIPSVLADQETMWQEVTLDDDLEQSRYMSCSSTELSKEIIQDVSILLDRLASKTNRLIGNFTTNLAESWMNIRCKFDGGKMYNRCNRGSWHSRCYGGALRKTFGPAWSPMIWQSVTGIRPGQAFTGHYRQRSLKLLSSLRSQTKPDVKARSYKRKMNSTIQSSSKKARRSYGDKVLDDTPDISSPSLQVQYKKFLNTHINLSDDKITKIEELTKDQSLSVTWIEERKKRITSSIFGDVIRRKPTINTGLLVKRILYPNFTGNIHTRHGLTSEPMTIREYIQQRCKEGLNITVTPSGLCIDRDNKFLAASPDGQVKYGNEVGLLEVKNVLHRKLMSFEEASKGSNFCLKEVGGTLKLKETHNFFYQVQGQMNILKLPWVDFVVRRTDPYQLHIERIFRDEHLWKCTMLPKLTSFYMKAVLPELASPRAQTTTGIREPEKPWFIPDTGLMIKKPTKPLRKTKRRSKQSSPSRSQVDEASSSTNSGPVASRRSRQRRTKFVGRNILHQWRTGEQSKPLLWYEGFVMDCAEGKDGGVGAVYEVKYKKEKEVCLVDHLQKDLEKGWLRFNDL